MESSLYRAFRFSIIFWLLFVSINSIAQTLTITGSVSAGGTLQSDALIDVYEYNSPIQTLHTDGKGSFSFPIVKGKEYLAVIYKPGYILQSYSLTDHKLSKPNSYIMKVDLAADAQSPDGLYFKEPVKRIAPEIDLRSFTETKFQLENIRPQARADSVLVLLNRAQANQYILIAKMKLGSAKADEKYSKQITENIKAEMASYSNQMLASNKKYDAILSDENAHVAATQKTKDEEQYEHLLLAQKDLAARLAERSNYFLLSQQKYLAKGRLIDMEAIRCEQQMNAARDSAGRAEFKRSLSEFKAAAVNARYMARDANEKFLSYNKYQVLNYQEYIEMLRYQQHKKDTIKPATAAVSKPAAKPRATVASSDTSDTLAKMDEKKREKVIQEALEEEERFKNYEETTEVKRIDGADVTVKDMRIADDSYELQIDKKKNEKHFKNGKPVTKLTFEFETKRRMVDVLNTIREVDKFGK